MLKMRLSIHICFENMSILIFAKTMGTSQIFFFFCISLYEISAADNILGSVFKGGIKVIFPP